VSLVCIVVTLGSFLLPVGDKDVRKRRQSFSYDTNFHGNWCIWQLRERFGLL